MLERKHAVMFVASYLDACALWRMYFPHLNMAGSNFACFLDKIKFERVVDSDIVVLQRCCTKQQLDFIAVLKSLGIKLIYDLDDNVWQLPKSNPAYEVYTAVREGFAGCIQLVDVITVSTRMLERAVRKHIKDLRSKVTGKEIPVVVCENRIDERVFAKPRKGNRLKVGWAGSSSHIGDLPIVARAINTLSQEYPDVLFEFRGCNPRVETPNAQIAESDKALLMSLYDRPNFQHALWMPVAEYSSCMPLWDWNIALAPVQSDSFNESKSCIKQIEAGYCGIPCLATAIRPYEEFCGHDPELKFLLCNNISFERKLRTLIEEPAMREELGKRSYEVATKYYSWRGPHEGWEKALQLARLA